MLGSLLIALATAALQVPQVDTAVYSDASVQTLVERATARRRVTDSAVADYRASVRYRLSAGFGRRRWAWVTPMVVEEQVAQVQWQAPNDLRVDVEGRRFRAQSDGLRLSSVFDRPWFVPRAVGDSVRVFSNDFPATGALHPLSAAGPAWYRYSDRGGVGLTLPDGRLLRLREIEITPRRIGAALIAGRILIDSASADVVRMTFRYVGTGLWVRVGDPRAQDSSSAHRINAVANRVLTVNADLEYALQDGKYWMPFRQAVFGTARIPVVSDAVVPFRAVTVFDDYRINTREPVAFTLPLDTLAKPGARRDSLRAARRGGQASTPDSLRSWDYAGRWPGGRYELHRASDDSLGRYKDWTEPLELRNPEEEDSRVRDADAMLATLSEELSGELTGERAHGIGYERSTDLMQYNRVQGLSFGLGYRVRMPVARFTSLYTTVRYGLSDERLTGRLTLRTDAPGVRLTAGGYREVYNLDPFAAGRTPENSINALFAAHDDGDYLVATGVGISAETSVGIGLDLVAGGRVERQRNAARTAESEINDLLGGTGVFPDNPPVDEGTVGSIFVRLKGYGATRWTFTTDLFGMEDRRVVGRVFGEMQRGFGGRRGATIRLKSGVATEPALAQTLFRLGGTNTVRGFSYGYQRAPAFWAAQLDLTPFGTLMRPVFFIDAGQAGPTKDLFSTEALVGGGVGLSLLRGMLRFDFSVPMSPDIGSKVRLDVIVRAVR